MRTPTLSSAFYYPNTAPSDSNELGNYLYSELIKVSAAITALSLGHLDKSYSAPTKPRDGDIRYADGTSWNPGSGAGVYVYKGSSWVLLG